MAVCGDNILVLTSDQEVVVLHYINKIINIRRVYEGAAKYCMYEGKYA